MKSMIIICLMLSGCAAAVPVLQGAGAVASIGTAVYTVTKEDRIVVYTKECLWTKPLIFSNAVIDAMNHDELVWTADYKDGYERNCE